MQRDAGQLTFQFNMTKVRGKTLVRLMKTLVKSLIQWRRRWLDLVSWSTVFTLSLRPYEINHISMNQKAKKTQQQQTHLLDQMLSNPHRIPVRKGTKEAKG